MPRASRCPNAEKCQPTAQGVERGLNLAEIGHAKLSRRAGGWSPQISNQVSHRDIDFVPHGRDDRHARTENGPGHDFFIECPQVFQTAAAPGEDQEVDINKTVRQPDRFNDLLGRSLALNFGRGDPTIRLGPSTMRRVSRNHEPQRRWGWKPPRSALETGVAAVCGRGRTGPRSATSPPPGETPVRGRPMPSGSIWRTTS